MYSGDPFPIEKSNLYKEWMMERAEIEQLKWKMSEDAGEDVGWDRAYWVWLTTYKSTWKKGIKESGLNN